MSLCMRRSLGLLALFVCFAGPAATRLTAQVDTSSGPPLVETDSQQRKSPSLFHNPRQESAAAQLAYAQKLVERGHERRARGAFNDLVHAWHDSPEAVVAQGELARLLLKAGKHQKAFDEYQYLIRYFAGQFPYEAVLERQFQIANAVRTERHMTLWVLPGMLDPSRALPLYEQIVENGPTWQRAAEALYYAGVIQERDKDYDLAVISYEGLLMRYPDSDFAADAAFRRASCLYQLASRSPRDELRSREALSACLAFARTYPTDPNAEEVKTMAGEMQQRLADMYYNRAIFYDRIAKRPRSAIIAYSDFIGKFPTSDRRKTADERIANLQIQLENDDDK
jgi:tetratricopeptide (TPR) repeat protein